ncbi:TPA: amidohydrolase family protein [Campylobacter coli]|nr:amidohydrolase family protein [Campylobacter coli]HEF9666133.1 amidohydrolase family protein [Campylobacter coli]HEF9679266.1 amidohydrolase family protein [Campylobacter coli]HEF9681028.1 amidohydrolase family protein [Campylobacter coli]HEF9682795.1 amidohydrolase family protein [Campylobacter coli]
MQKIFDAHLHLWDLNEVPISWLKDDERLNQNYDFSRMKKEYENYEFLGALYVECNGDDIDKESLYALSLKQTHSLLLCLADLRYKENLSSFREVLHTSQKGAKRLFEADFKKKIEILKNFQIPFEACMKNEELSFLEKFLNKNPNLKVVLNHLGSPKIDRLNEYKKDLNLLKKFPNLYIKLSVPDDFSEQTSKEFIYELFAFFKENFSEDKFIFGSNYPVAKIAPAKWAKLIIESKIFKNLNKIFYQNALSIYKEDRCKDMAKS